MAKRVRWSTEARSDIRAMDRFLKIDAGNVKQLEGFGPPLFRLRVGAWRFIYRTQSQDTIEIVRRRNRRETYR